MNSIEITFDSKFFVSGSTDKTLKVWNIEEVCGSLNEKIENVSLINTIDNEFQLTYNLNDINSIINLKSSDRNPTFCGIKHTFDYYLQDPLQFYNIIEALKFENYLNLSFNASQVIISKYSFTITHIFCFFGNSKELQALINPNFVIKCDSFEKTPFYYAIIKNNQSCVDLLLDFTISLFENTESQHFRTSLYAIRNDFVLLIKNSSRNLNLLLEKLLISSKIYFAKLTVNQTLPKFHFYECFLPLPQDFTDKNGVINTEETPVVLQYTPFEIPSFIGSENSVELLSAIVYSKTPQIYKTPIIQAIVQYQ